MHHLPEHINQDKKGGKIKIWTQQQIKQNIGAKEIQQVNHKFSISDGPAFSRLFWTVVPRQLRRYQKFVDSVIVWCMDSIFEVKNTPIIRKDESGLKI